MENVGGAPSGYKPHPWLIFIGGEKLENQVFYDVTSNSKTTSFTGSIPESIINRSVLMSTNINGWLLLELDVTKSESSDQWCLWNAITQKSINLPAIEVFKSKDYCIDYVLLTRSPDNCDCAILVWMKDPIGILYCYVNEDDDWTFRDYQEELIEFKGIGNSECNRFRDPVAYAEDMILMITCSNVLAKIEIKKPKSLVIRHDLSYSRWSVDNVAGPWRCVPVRWVACCGDLLQINVTFGGLEYKQIMSIVVFKLDFSDMSWMIVDNYPNATFFINGKQCLACPISSANSNKIGNQVYIVENDVDKERLLLYTHHIQRKTLKTSLIASAPNNESKPYWILIPNDQALTKVEEESDNGGDGKKHQLSAERDIVEVTIILDDLHVDILRVINSHLESPSDYLNFRATSKSCREVGSAKEWRNERAPKSDNSSSPWLIFPNSHEIGKCVFSMVDPISRNKYSVTTPENLGENLIICYSADGWLLMSSPFSNLRFYNPLTKSIICLPGMNGSWNASHYIFNFTPNNLNCVIAAISVDHDLQYLIARRNKLSKDEFDQWTWEVPEMTRDYDIDNPISWVRQSNVNAVIVDAIFYFLVDGGNIAYLSQEDYQLRIHNLEEPCSKLSYEQCFLAECDGDLISIYIGNEWKWLRGFKFNESDMVWKEVKELKNNNLYLSNVSSSTIRTQSPQVGNRIYFSRFHQESIVYYSFSTQKFHLSDGKDSVLSNYNESEEQMYSCWFNPNWKLE